MLEKLPVIDQEDDDLKFADQYAQATELFITAVKKSNLGWFRRFKLIYKSSRHQQDIFGRIAKANAGDISDLDDAMDGMRENFNHIMSDIFKMHPSLIAKTNAELATKNKPQPMFTPHGRDQPMKATDYFNQYRKIDEEDKKNPAKEKVTLVRIVNKTSIPVRLVGGGQRQEQDQKEERTLRQKWFGFLNQTNQRRTGRSIFRGGSSRVARGLVGVIGGGGRGSAMDLPNIISLGLVRMFGRSLTLAGSLLMMGLKTVFKLGITRLALLAVPLILDVASDGINKIVSYIFGEDSGIAKAVKAIFESDMFKGGVSGGVLGAGIGMLFGPAGMFWGFIIGSIAGLLKEWIDDDGPKKLKEGAEKMWESVTKSIDDLYKGITKGIGDFFGSIGDYFRKLFNPNQSEKLASINNDMEELKAEKERNERILANPNTPKWAANQAQRNLDSTNQQLETLENKKANVKTDEETSRDEDLKNLAWYEDRLKGRFRGPNEKRIYQERYDALKDKIEKNSVSTGLMAPLTSAPVSMLHDDMIGKKRMEFMNSISPSMINAPTTNTSSTRVTSSTSNSMVMQLSPISNDRIN